MKRMCGVPHAWGGVGHTKNSSHAAVRENDFLSLSSADGLS